MTRITDYHIQYYAWELGKRHPIGSAEKFAGAVANAQVDLKPHQLNAALLAFRSPLSKGAILADEVGLGETILGNHLVRHLMNYSDVDYIAHADVLFDLAGQMTAHIARYIEGEDAARAVRDHEKVLAAEIYTQMREHRELLTPDGTETRVHRGYERLKESAVSIAKGQVLQLRDTPRTKPDLLKSVVTGFQKCLYTYQKFHAYPEMVLARVLEREALKWFRPVLGQFQIWYSTIKGQSQYNPDFVAELETEILLIEVKDDEEIEDRVVKAKERMTRDYCTMASEHAAMHGGKPWRYWLVKAQDVNESMGLNDKK